MSLADNLARVHPRSLGYQSHRLAALMRGARRGDSVAWRVGSS